MPNTREHAGEMLPVAVLHQRRDAAEDDTVAGPR